MQNIVSFIGIFLQKRHVILRSLPIEATPYLLFYVKTMYSAADFCEIESFLAQLNAALCAEKNASFAEYRAEGGQGRLIGLHDWNSFPKVRISQKSARYYDSFHEKYYTPEIHHIDKLKFLGTNSNYTKV